MLIHGARAAVLRVKRDSAPFCAWLDRLDARAHTNVVVVAMANKLAPYRLGRTLQRQRLPIISHGHIAGAEKNAFGSEALKRSHFPAPRRRSSSPPRSAQGNEDERTVTTAWLQPAPDNGLQRPSDL